MKAEPRPESLDSPNPPGLPLAMRLAVFSLCYFFSAELARFVSPTNGTYISFWLPAATFLASLLMVPTREWKWIVLAALPANFAFDLHQGTPPLVILGFYLSNAVEALLGAWLVRTFTAYRPRMETLRELGGIIFLGGLAGPVVGGVFGALVLNLAGFNTHFWIAYAAWVLGKSMAVLLLVPAILCLDAHWPKWRGVESALRILEACVLAVGLAASAYYIFVLDRGVNAPYKIRLMIFTLWASMRFGVRGGAFSTLFLAILSASFTVRYQIGLTAADLKSETYVLTLQSFLAMASLFSLVPAIAIAERDRTVNTLQESEARFRNFSEASGEGVVLSCNGRILDVNDQVITMFGHGRGELLGRSIADFLASSSSGAFERNVHSSGSFRYEATFQRSTGERFLAEVRVKESRIGDDLIRMSAIRDINSQRTAERRLLHFADIVQSSDDAIIGKDLDGVITSWNPAAEKIFGYPADEAIGHRLTKLYPADRANEEQEILDEIRRGGRIHHYETNRVRKDGSLVTISATVSPIVDKAGKVIGVSKIARDITEQKEAERALQLFRTLVDGANDGIELMDAGTGRYLDMNEGGLKNLGYTREEILQLGIQDVKPSYQESEFQEVVRSTRGGQTIRVESARRRKDGTIFPTEVTIRMVSLDREYLVAVVRDVTEHQVREARRIELETLLRRSQKMETVGRFAAGIAHDFNNILGAIFGCAALLEEDTVGNEEAQESTREIIKAATRARDLVHQILTFSNLQDPQRHTFCINETIEDVLNLLRPSFSQDIRFESTLESERLWVSADPSQVHRVLMNIAKNGCQAMSGQQGTLRVETAHMSADPSFLESHPGIESSELVRISIADTGRGIPSDAIEHIFEPFFTTRPVGQGAGLGLAIAYGIVQANRGSIEVYSQDGGGSVFDIYLPAAQVDVDPSATETHTTLDIAGKGERLLVLDDDRALLETTRNLLRRLGYEVIAFADPVEALAYLREAAKQIDLIISDLTMPTLSGVEVAMEAQGIRPELPIILTSGFNHGLDAESMRKVGIAGFLQKPVTLRSLGQKVRQALDDVKEADLRGI